MSEKLDVTMHKFGSIEPPDRIIGIETEYTVPARLYNTGLETLATLGYLAVPGVASWLRNGGVLYCDLGHLEYASPESLGPLDALASDHAGANIMNALWRRHDPTSKPPLRRSATFDIDTYVQSDQHTQQHDAGLLVSTKGYHENYLIPRPDTSTDKELFKRVIGSYLATRAIWYGSGMYLGGRFSLTQKSTGIGAGLRVNGYGSYRASEGEKPLAAILDGTDKIGAQAAILEVRNADPHMLRAATLMGLGVTSLVLRLLEVGIIAHSNAAKFAVTDEYRATQLSDVHANITGNVLTTLDGENISPLELQMRFVQAVHDLGRHVKLPSDEQYVAQKWLEICIALDAYIHGNEAAGKSLKGHVEWFTKQYYAQKLAAKHDKVGNPYFYVAFDTQWTALTDTPLVTPRLSRLAESDTLFTGVESRIAERTVTPPRTRAQKRIKIMQDFGVTSVDWARVIDTRGNPHTMESPYADCVE